MFSIISNNCFGYQFYNEIGIKYETPFIGMCIYGEDYIKLLEKLFEYLNHDLKFIEFSKIKGATKYPVALLNDIEIHFWHYKTNEEVLVKWNRRKKRIDKSRLFFKYCDRDGCTYELLTRFHNLKFENKVSFTKKGKFNINKHWHNYEIETNQDCVPNGDVLYNISKNIFDIRKWIFNCEINTDFSDVKKILNLGDNKKCGYGKDGNKFIKNIVTYFFNKNFFKNKSIIDLGCGKGDLLLISKYLQSNDITGVDEHIEVKKIMDFYNFKYLKFNYITDNYNINKKYDIITLFRSIPHNISKKECVNLLKNIDNMANKNTVVIIVLMPYLTWDNILDIFKENNYILYEYNSDFNKLFLEGAHRYNKCPFRILKKIYS